MGPRQESARIHGVISGANIRTFGSRGHSLSATGRGVFRTTWKYDVSSEGFAVAPVLEHVRNGKALTSKGRLMLERAK